MALKPPERRRVASGSPYEAQIGFCRAMQIGDRILVAGTTPIWPDGSVDPDPAAQAGRCFTIISEALGQLGATLSDVVRTRMFLIDAADADAVGRVHGAIFADNRPVATMVVIAGLLDPRWRIEIETEAVVSTSASR
ncbi:MAG: RidA family protein [Actinomycetota bacterium]|nr:RidA family protein [Actinomycetota bacterium]